MTIHSIEHEQLPVAAAIRVFFAEDCGIAGGLLAVERSEHVGHVRERVSIVPSRPTTTTFENCSTTFWID